VEVTNEAMETYMDETLEDFSRDWDDIWEAIDNEVKDKVEYE
jgi:hypothetical protein